MSILDEFPIRSDALCECGARYAEHHPGWESMLPCQVSPQVGHKCPCEVFIAADIKDDPIWRKHFSESSDV